MSTYTDDYDWREEAHEATADEMAELESGRYAYSCTDGMCGALDCSRCHPGAIPEPDEDEPDTFNHTDGEHRSEA